MIRMDFKAYTFPKTDLKNLSLFFSFQNFKMCHSRFIVNQINFVFVLGTTCLLFTLKISKPFELQIFVHDQDGLEIQLNYIILTQHRLSFHFINFLRYFSLVEIFFT